jgi:hypothetical protein
MEKLTEVRTNFDRVVVLEVDFRFANAFLIIKEKKKETFISSKVEDDER